MRDDIGALTNVPEPSPAILPFLASDNDVLRCAALRALVASAGPSGADWLRERLIEALLDPDPDLRSDAMEALVAVAQPDDADTLRRSLEGDPVREVKLAAIAALARLKDSASVDLLRALALSRCEGRIAWEDEDSDWEDWLDIQIAAIRALGEIGVEPAIDDMLTAREDALAQSLDIPVFEAFAALGDRGAAYLLAIVETEGGLAAKRAAEALCRCAPDRLWPYRDVLLGAEDARLRALGLPLLSPEGAELRALVTADPAPEIRAAALDRCAGAQPGLAREALCDPAPEVQARALEHLEPPPDKEARDTLVANLRAWMEAAPLPLMSAAAGHLPRFDPAAGEALSALASNSTRPLQARVTAARALSACAPPVPIAMLVDLLRSPAHQVRMAGLVGLRARAIGGEKAASAFLAAAIRGTLLDEDDRLRNAGPDDAAMVATPDVAAPKGEGATARRIRISSDGEIVEDDPAAGVEGPESNSTLATIFQTSDDARTPSLAEDMPEEAPAKRRKRRAIEGPDEIADALALDAIRIADGLADPDLRGALQDALSDVDPARRAAAWQAACDGCVRGVDWPQAREAAEAALRDDIPPIRLSAFKVLHSTDPDPARCAQAMADPDALVRAEAVACLPADNLLAYVADPSLAVRSAVCARLLAENDPVVIGSAVRALIAAERSDTVGELLAGSEAARNEACAIVADPSTRAKDALVVLTGFAQAGGQA